MPLRTTLLSIGTFAALATTSVVGGHRAPSTVAPVAPHAAASDIGPSAALQVDDAIAAAVIGSISRQFETPDVVVQLGDVRVQPASIQDREVVGTGRLRIGDEPRWIPFRFAALYDAASTEVTYPRLDLGSDGAVALSNGSPIVASLDRQVMRALEGEFQSQPVAWAAEALRGTDLGRYVRVDGDGRVDFGPDGVTAARVHGLYDRSTGRWLRLRYELGGEALPEAADTALASL